MGVAFALWQAPIAPFDAGRCWSGIRLSRVYGLRSGLDEGKEPGRKRVDPTSPARGRLLNARVAPHPTQRRKEPSPLNLTLRLMARLLVYLEMISREGALRIVNIDARLLHPARDQCTALVNSESRSTAGGQARQSRVNNKFTTRRV